MKYPESRKRIISRTLSTEDYLRSVTIGEPQLLNSSIHLAPYDPKWPAKFSLQAIQIGDALAEKVLRLEHVGSTAVPGLSAKPIIDIVLAVLNSADESSYVPPLEEKGFALRIREPGWFEHRLLKAPGGGGNLHVFSIGCEEINRMVAFRDWLRMHDDDRKLYQEAKFKLAAQTWKHIQNYADAKSEIVRGILARALGQARAAAPLISYPREVSCRGSTRVPVAPHI